MKINLFHKLFVWTALLAITTSCSFISTPMSNPTQATTLLPTQTFAPTLENGLTPTSSQSGPTQTVAPTYMGADIQHECVTADESQTLPNVQGAIAMLGANNDLSLWNLETGKNTALGRIEILNGVSSNGQKLAYIDADLHKLIIVSSQGEKLATIVAPNNWVEVLGWASSNNILVDNMPFHQDGSWEPPSSTIVLNLSDGTQTELSPNYPNIYGYASGAPNLGPYSYSITAYDPTLSYVVYPTETSTESSIVLWDIANHRQIARLQLPFPWNTPLWRNDGESFLVSVPLKYSDWQGNVYKNVPDDSPYIGGNELFSVNRSGEIKRLTYLTTKYMAEEQSYVWSPDNKMVAFWLKIGTDNAKWELATLNLETSTITSYCIDGGDGSYSIFWSPDGNQIMSTIQNSDSDTKIVFLDIQKKIAVLVPGKEIVVGWLSTIAH